MVVVGGGGGCVKRIGAQTPRVHYSTGPCGPPTSGLVWPMGPTGLSRLLWDAFLFSVCLGPLCSFPFLLHCLFWHAYGLLSSTWLL